MRPSGSAPSREVARYVAGLLPGYRVAYGRVGSDTDGSRSRGQHPYLWTPEGDLVRDERGVPFVVPGSPGSRRWQNNLKTRLRRAGLIT